ncbi:MAG: histidine phosphatase family protein [Deltaproteobacteria bacterium]|nr:histidine phosphatase family protein [Deltaproteobacteria bacterium]
MSTIYMFRHGQASFGQDNYDQLSPTGYRQARLVAEHLRVLGITFDAVYTGELARQKQTFQSMADVFAASDARLPTPVETADLNEYNSTGVWQHYYPAIIRDHPELELDDTSLGQNPKQFQHVFARIVQRWINDPHATPGIESWRTFRSRIAEGLNTIMRQEGSGKNVMVFTSAGPVATAVQMATGMPDERCIGISWQVLNASTTRFRYNEKEITLVGFNDVAALERQGDPGLLTYR